MHGERSLAGLVCEGLSIMNLSGAFLNNAVVGQWFATLRTLLPWRSYFDGTELVGLSLKTLC